MLNASTAVFLSALFDADNPDPWTLCGDEEWRDKNLPKDTEDSQPRVMWMPNISGSSPSRARSRKGLLSVEGRKERTV